MLSWSSSSFWGLALAIEVLTLWGAPCSARAGDTIEFSTPSASLEVPQVLREDKEALNSGLQSLKPHHQDPEVWGPPQVVIVSPQRAKGPKAWDPFYDEDQGDELFGGRPEGSDYSPLDSRQSGSRSYDRRSSTYNSESSLRPMDGATNFWEARQGMNADEQSAFSWRRRTETGGEDAFGGRRQGVDAEGRREYPLNRTYSERSSTSDNDKDWLDRSGSSSLRAWGRVVDPEQTSAWLHNVYRSAEFKLARARKEKYTPYNAQDAQSKTFDELPGPQDSSAGAFTAPDSNPNDFRLNSSWGSRFGSEWETERGLTPIEGAGAPRPFLPFVEAQKVNRPARTAQQQQTSSFSVAPDHPSVLRFPSTPGSVFPNP